MAASLLTKYPETWVKGESGRRIGIRDIILRADIFLLIFVKFVKKKNCVNNFIIFWFFNDISFFVQNIFQT